MAIRSEPSARAEKPDALLPAPEEKLRVLFFAWNYYPVPAGGAERQARLQAEELIRRGHSVTVVCPRTHGARSGWMDGVRVVRIFRINHRPGQRITYLLSLLRFMCVHGWKYDLVHVHLANLQADIVVPLARLFRRPTYVKVACGGPIGEVTRLAKVATLTRWVGLRHANRVQALSSEIVDELRSIRVRTDRIVSIPNGLDLRGFRQASCTEKEKLRRELDLPPEKDIVLFAGRFATYKGLDDLLAVWRKLELNAAALVLVGTAETDRPVKEIESQPNLIVRGWTNDIRKYMLSSDVFAYPSYSDGMSNALMEAMACGLAIVASTSGATRDMIEDGRSGFLFEPGDREMLAERLQELLSNAELRAEMGRHANAASARYDITTVVDRIEEQYKTLVRER